MVEFHNEEELRAWLEGRPHGVCMVIAARAALRVLPLLADEFTGGKLKPDAVASDIILPVLRVAAVSWSAAKFPKHRTDLAAAAMTAYAADATAAASAIRAAAASANDAAHKAAAAYATRDAAAASYAADTTAAAATAGRHAAIAAFYEDASNAGADDGWGPADADAEIAADAEARHAHVDLWDTVSADATRLEGADAMQPDELAGEPLWLMGVPRFVWDFTFVFDRELPELGGGWDVWIRWYEARTRGGPTYQRATTEQNEQLEIARALIANEIWGKGTAAVNAEIRRLEMEILGEWWEPGEKEPDDDGELAQGPGPYRYFWREGKIEANPATDVPFDVNLAEEFLDALREKLAETRGVLTGNYADPPVSAAIDRLEPLLEGSAADISIGLIYMRAVSLEAFAQAYADSSSERKNNISATLADFSDSLSALTACYPGIQTLEANRLAIELQSADAVAVESGLREIEDVATASEIAGESVVEALATGREDVDALSEKAEQSASHSVRATYIEERADAAGPQRHNPSRS